VRRRRRRLAHPHPDPHLLLPADGHLFIAQPPLYKVSEGKREAYLKDDREYQEHLIRRIQESWTLRLGGDGAPDLAGAPLGRFLAEVDRFRQNLDRLVARGFPAAALRVALLGGLHTKDDLGDRAKVEAVARKVEESGFQDVRLATDDEHGTTAIVFRARRDGVVREVRIDWNLVATAEYRALGRNRPGLDALATRRFVLRHQSGESSEHERLEEVLEALYTAAKKGLSVQRYKGLGEMNAEQLWETTMDPAKRHLLQVRIEDAVAADEIFTVLMGDQVEPRRDFIVENALEVKNLDV
jgi:DNA gyrase subunit B